MAHSAGSSPLSSPGLSEDELPPASSPSHPPSNSTISDDDHDHLHPTMPPAKKRKRNPRISRNLTPNTHDSPAASPALSLDDLSSDTEGSVPPSPRAHAAGQPATQDEFALATDFVHVCLWEGCDAGDLGNQDELVQHVQDAHVTQTAPKQKITCEWSDCKTKGKTQTSAYTLKGHMKSHTKDKPHYCSLPECDRAFTRSDALAKHMRTVHDSESLRTTEHYVKPKPVATIRAATPASGDSPALSVAQPVSAAQDESQTAPPSKTLSLKLLLAGKDKDRSSHGTTSADSMTAEAQSPVSPSQRDEAFGAFPPAIRFTDAELALDRRELYQLLRRQIKWAEEDAADLARELEAVERRRKQEWLSKELVLENLLEADVLGAMESGVLRDADPVMMPRMVQFKPNWDAVRAASKLPLTGPDMPWYRHADRMTALDETFGLSQDYDDEGSGGADDLGRGSASAANELKGGTTANGHGQHDDDTEMVQE